MLFFFKDFRFRPQGMKKKIEKRKQFFFQLLTEDVQTQLLMYLFSERIRTVLFGQV